MLTDLFTFKVHTGHEPNEKLGAVKTTKCAILSRTTKIQHDCMSTT